MAWILIASAIPVALWNTHGKRTGRDLDHRRTVFARRWRDRGLRRLISCEERGHVEQDTEHSRNKQWSGRHRGGLLAQDRKRGDRTIAGSESAAVCSTLAGLMVLTFLGFSIDGAEVAPYYTDTIEDDYEYSAPSRITPCGVARHESRTFSHVL